MQAVVFFRSDAMNVEVARPRARGLAGPCFLGPAGRLLHSRRKSARLVEGGGSRACASEVNIATG